MSKDEVSQDYRDGFAICRLDGEEVRFVPCTFKGEATRERVLSGLLRQIDRERFYIEDTRDDA